jgi:hypothetical protein
VRPSRVTPWIKTSLPEKVVAIVQSNWCACAS